MLESIKKVMRNSKVICNVFLHFDFMSLACKFTWFFYRLLWNSNNIPCQHERSWVAGSTAYTMCTQAPYDPLYYFYTRLPTTHLDSPLSFCRVLHRQSISMQRLWFSGRIDRCHRSDPGSIPGRRNLLIYYDTIPTFFLLLSWSVIFALSSVSDQFYS